MKDALGAVQSILVLGGGSDIALATCRHLVDRRARTVVLAARRPDELDTTAKELRDLGATTVEPVAFDATATDTHAAFVDETFDRFGDFDLVLVAFGVIGDQERTERDPSAAVYSSSNRSGRLKSSWIVEICQVRPIASLACTEIFGP